MIQAKEVIKERVQLNQSSLLESIGYDFSLAKMEVVFRHGKKRKLFTQVSSEEYLQLVTAPSVGKAFLKWYHRNKEKQKITWLEFSI